MSVHLKPIVPKKMKGNPSKEINAAITQTLKAGQALFQRTTRTWHTRVEFVVAEPDGGRGAVGTDSDIYGYVTRGTRPHLIKPKAGKVLVFGSGTYSPKTRPGFLTARAGVTRGTQGVARPVFAKQVHHPGTKARGFEEDVARQLQPILETNVTAAILKSIEG